MTKYILPFSNQWIVLSERGFLTSRGEWSNSMDDAAYFQSTLAAITTLQRIDEGFNIREFSG